MVHTGVRQQGLEQSERCDTRLVSQRRRWLQISCALWDHASVHDAWSFTTHRWPEVVVAFGIIPHFADGKTTAQPTAESGERRTGVIIGLHT